MDILKWLAKAVLENDDDVEDAAKGSSFPTKTEDHDDHDFDLLQYVDSAEDCKDNLDEQLMNELESIEMKPLLAVIPQDVDLDQYVDPSSPPYCKSQEIIDYPHDEVEAIGSGSRTSASPIFQQDEMEEPNWLSTWDSIY